MLKKYCPLRFAAAVFFRRPPSREQFELETKIMLKINVTVPTLKFMIKLETYGMEIKGAVPKLALMDMEAT
jgi:hypothetical protein